MLSLLLTGVHGHVKLEVAFLAELGLTHSTLPGLHVRVGQQVSHQKPPPLEPLPTNLTYKRLLTCRKIWKQVLWNVGQLVPLITGTMPFLHGWKTDTI